MTDPIYLDHNATTPVAPEVLDAMLPWLRGEYGNPSSTHPYGQRAAQAMAAARGRVAELIGASEREIVFTGCATEANNLALLGVAHALGAGKRHLVVSAVEHPAVMAPALVLRDQGWALTVLPVDAFGRISRTRVPDGSAIAKAIDYSLNHWVWLGRYLLDGDVPIDNNHVENRIRPWALGRRNWLFIGSQLAGERAAVVMSLLQSAKLNGHEPWAYLKDVLTRLPAQLNSRIEELLPHKWQPVG